MVYEKNNLVKIDVRDDKRDLFKFCVQTAIMKLKKCKKHKPACHGDHSDDGKRIS